MSNPSSCSLFNVLESMIGDKVVKSEIGRTLRDSKTKCLLIATHNLAFARRCHRVLRLHRGHVEEVAPESLRRESRCRQKVSRLWTFSGTVRTNGRTGSAVGLQVVVAMLQRNGSRVRSIMNRSSLGTWVRWYLDCIMMLMMYGPKGFSRVWGLSLTRQLTGELGGERAHV